MDRYTLSQQVINFESTLSQLRTMMSPGDLNTYLSRSIAVMVFGSNDYINNYLLPSLYSTSINYNPQQFSNLLLNHYARQLVVSRDYYTCSQKIKSQTEMTCVCRHYIV